MPKYKLIATDLDGTLVRDDHTCSPLTVQTLIAAQTLGVRVAIVSGRPTWGSAPLAAALRLADFGGFLVSYNGGEVLECATGRALHRAELPPDIIPTLHDFARSRGLALLTYIDGAVVTESDTDPYVLRSSTRNGMPIRHTSDFCRDVTCAVPKCIITGRPDVIEALEPQCRALLAGRADAYRSEPFFLEVVPPGVDKAAGLAVIERALGITPADILAFGDGMNDLPMLRHAGTGVAMGNAAPEIKAAARLVTLSNEEDGVAKYVREII